MLHCSLGPNSDRVCPQLKRSSRTNNRSIISSKLIYTWSCTRSGRVESAEARVYTIPRCSLERLELHPAILRRSGNVCADAIAARSGSALPGSIELQCCLVTGRMLNAGAE